MQSLQLLACPPEIQLGKFPPFVDAPDELALDFDICRSAFVGNFRAELTAEQLHSLELIDRTFEEMDKDRFTPEGVTHSGEWRKIRELAAGSLKAFGWPLDDPPRRDDEFVPGGSRKNLAHHLGITPGLEATSPVTAFTRTLPARCPSSLTCHLAQPNMC